jgi:hypothetical protein
MTPSPNNIALTIQRVNQLYTKNIDLTGRRCVNATDAVDLQDYVTLNDLNNKILALTASSPALNGNQSPISNINGKLSIMPQGISKVYIANNAIGSAQLANDAITVANSTRVVQALALVDSIIGSVGLNKLAATTVTQGTAIFTGDAIFSRGSSNPLIDISSVGLFLYGVANSGGTAGLTASPYVAIENTGIGSFSGAVTTWLIGTTYAANAIVTHGGVNYYSIAGGNVGHTPPNATYWVPMSSTSSVGPNVFINPTSINLYTVGSSITDPFVSLQATGLGIYAALYQLEITASGIQGSYNGTVNMQLYQGSLILTSGLYNITVQAGSLTMSYNSTNYLSMSSTGITLAAGTVLTSPTITVTGSTFTVNIDTTNGVLLTNTSNASVTTLTSGYVDVYDDTGGRGVAEGLLTKNRFSISTNISGTTYFVSAAVGTGSAGTLLQISNTINSITLEPSNIQISVSGHTLEFTPSIIQFTDSTNNTVLTSTGFTNLGTGVAYNGTVAAAVAAGKSFVGGICQS